MCAHLDPLGRSALHYAAHNGNASEVARLIETGEPIDQPDRNGWTPLHFGAQANSVAVVQLLIAAGAAIDTKDSNGNTPLFRAVFNSRGNGDVIVLLRNAGSDPLLKNHHGASPYSLAQSIANYDVARFFSDVRVS